MNGSRFTPEQEFANMIMSMTDAEFDMWANKMSLEEIERATYTIRKATLQLNEEMECLQEEEESAIEEQIFLVGCPDAEEILSKFTLQGSK